MKKMMHILALGAMCVLDNSSLVAKTEALYLGPSDEKIASKQGLTKTETYLLMTTERAGVPPVYHLQEGLANATWNLNINERDVRACWINFARKDKISYVHDIGGMWGRILAQPDGLDTLKHRLVYADRIGIRNVMKKVARDLIKRRAEHFDDELAGKILWHLEATEYLRDKICKEAEANFSWLEKVVLYAVTKNVDEFPCDRAE